MDIKLGNIIYREDLVNHEKVEYINYIHQPVNISSHFRNYIYLNSDLPTLYVGWKFLKEVNSSDPLIKSQSILDKKIMSNRLFWEFSFNENKSEHVNGIESFVNDVPFYYFSSRYNYINLDPVCFLIKDISELMLLLPKEIDGYYNYKNEMLYILKEKQIWGVDLNMYSFFQFNINEIIEKIIKRSKINHIDINADTYQKYYKIFPNFDNLKRYLITLLIN